MNANKNKNQMTTLFELKITGTFRPGFKRYVKQLADENDIKGRAEKINKKEIKLLFQGEKSRMQFILQTILSDKSKAVIKEHSLQVIPHSEQLKSFRIIRNKEEQKTPIWKRMLSLSCLWKSYD